MDAVMDILVQAQDEASSVIEQIGDVGVEAARELERAMEQAGDAMDSIGDDAREAMQQVERATEGAEAAIDDLADAAEQAGEDMEAAAQEQKEAMQSVVEGIGMAGAAMTAFAEIQQESIVKMEKFAYLTGMSKDSVSDLVDSVSDASFNLESTILVLEKGRKEGLKGEEQLKKYAEGWKIVAKATGQEAEELMEFAPILDRANASLAEGTEAMDAFGWVTSNTTSSVPELMDAVAGSMMDIGDAEIKLNQMAAALKIVEEMYGVTGPEAIAVFQGKIGEAAGAVDENGNELGWSMETFAAAIGTTTEEINKLAEGVEGSGKTMEELAKITDENASLFDKLMAKVGDFTAQHGDAIQVMGSFGTIMSGLTPIILLAMNATAIWTTVTAAATGVGAAFGAVMAFITSPAMLVVAAIAAIIAIGYLLIKHWDTVKEVAAAVWDGIVTILEAAWEGIKKGAEIAFKVLTWQWQLMYFVIKKAIEWIMEIGPKMWEGIKNGAKAAFDFVKGIWNGMGDFFKNLFEGIVSFLKAPFNFAIDGVNTLIRALNSINIKIPDWVPLLGGKDFGFDIPNIPRLHTGGIFHTSNGMEEGLALLKEGEMVIDPMQTRRMTSEGDGESYTFIIELDGKVLAKSTGKHLPKYLKLRGV
jgi:hypothetical protein